jgi:2-dehydropantoate 2-reductase
MKIAIVGAGAVGGYYGVRLARAGHEVRFLARGAQADAMRRSGLSLRSELGDDRLFPANVAEDAAAIGPADLVLVAVKLWDTEAAARTLPPMIGAGTAVLSLQNGVDKEEAIAAVVGRGPVLGGLTYILADRPEPGVVVHSGKLQRVIAGELDGARSERLNAVVAAFAGAGVDAVASPDIRRELWQKLAFLAATSAVTAVARETFGPLRARPETRALIRDAMAEVVAVARAAGSAIDDGFVDDRMRFVDSLPAGGRASMAQDLLRGARLELEWLSGAVVRHGERLGVPTPVHRTLVAALAPFADGRPDAPQAAGASSRRRA